MMKSFFHLNINSFRESTLAILIFSIVVGTIFNIFAVDLMLSRVTLGTIMGSVYNTYVLFKVFPFSMQLLFPLICNMISIFFVVKTIFWNIKCIKVEYYHYIAMALSIFYWCMIGILTATLSDNAYVITFNG